MAAQAPGGAGPGGAWCLERARGLRVGRLTAALVLVVTVALVAGCASSLPTHTPAAASGGSVYEWGKPVASGGPGAVPTAVQHFANTVAIDAGNNSDVVVLSNGTVWGWGATKVASSSMTVVQVSGLKNVIQAPVDGNHDFAALEQPGDDPACPNSSAVRTWGLNMQSDLGLGDTKQDTYSTPRDVTELDCRNVVQLAAAAQHMFALTASGQVYVWGGSGPVLGLGSGGHDAPSPTINPALTALTHGSSAGVQLTAGSVTGGLLVDGQAYTWGLNQHGQCGCGSTAASVTTPTPVRQGSLRFTWIDQGGNLGNNGHTLALTAQGAVWAWGDGADGQLGDGGRSDHDLPVAVMGLPKIAAVRAGGIHSMALDTNGNVWCWGGNSFGQIGNGSNNDLLVPIEVLRAVSLISAGSYHSLAT